MAPTPGSMEPVNAGFRALAAAAENRRTAPSDVEPLGRFAGRKPDEAIPDEYACGAPEAVFRDRAAGPPPGLNC